MRLININNIKLKSAVLGLMLLFSSSNLFAQAATKAPDMGSIYKQVWFYVFLFVLLCLVIAIVSVSVKIFDLSKMARGKKAEGFDWNKLMANMFIIALIAGLYGVYWEYTNHGRQILPQAASLHGVEVDFMFKVTLILTTIVFVGTHILLFSFSYIYRYRKGEKAYYYPHNNTIEFAWTIIPTIVLTVLVTFGFILWRKIFHNPSKDPIQVEITAEQFAWTIRYAGHDGKIGLKNYKLINGINPIGVDFKDVNSLDDTNPDELVIPINKPVRLTLNAKDVIHSFYAPHFRVQMNCVPGMPTYFEFTPTISTAEMKIITKNPKFDYLFYCSKVCGGGHYNMQKKIRVVSESEYQVWLKEQPIILNDGLRKAFNLPVDTKAAPQVKDSTQVSIDSAKKVALN